MSGHSKWSKVKHQKEAADSARGKIFTKLAKAIIIAVRAGGGTTSPDANFRLRIAIDKARSFNMPKENIKHAIERAKGGDSSNDLEEVIYEAFGPQGIGMVIVATTNNSKRCVAEIKNILERNGGALVNKGSVSHFFRYVGKICSSKGSKSFDEVMEAVLNLGAIDINDKDQVEIYTNSPDLTRIKESLVKQGFNVSSSELIYQPITTISISDENTRGELNRLVSELTENEDVQKVFTNVAP